MYLQIEYFYYAKGEVNDWRKIIYQNILYDSANQLQHYLLLGQAGGDEWQCGVQEAR